MIGGCWRVGWLLLALVVPQATAVPPPTPAQGTIGSSGKFIPNPGPAASPHTAPLSREDAEAALRKDLKIEQLSPGKLQIGQVILDQASHSIRFPATVNMVDGPVEYALVTAKGKAHESVFVTSTAVRDIHLAMLLLGIQPPAAVKIIGKTLQIPAAAAIRIRVEWETNGPPASHPLAAMIALAEGSPDQPARQTLAEGNWLYKGSAFDAAGFCALREGSIIALIGDDLALVNNPGQDRDQDDIHVPNKPLLPRRGMPVTMVITRGFPAGPPQPTR